MRLFFVNIKTEYPLRMEGIFSFTVVRLPYFIRASTSPTTLAISALPIFAPFIL